MRIFLQANPTIGAIIAALLMLSLLAISYLAFEPMVTYGASQNFTVTQQVTSEIAFKTNPNNVTMTPNLQGLTGGNAFGTSTFAITTNNPTGYNVTIGFASTTAMLGHAPLTSKINNYTPTVSGTPDYNWSVGANTGEFGFTIKDVTAPSDIDTKFKDNGSACNGGYSGTTTGKCWYGAADARTAVTLISSASATPGTGATSSVIFQVGITANPIPAIQTGFYTATATLTAVTNP